MTRIFAAAALTLSLAACASPPPSFVERPQDGDLVRTAGQAIEIGRAQCARLSKYSEYGRAPWQAVLHVRTWHVWRMADDVHIDSPAWEVDVHARDGKAEICLESVTVD